ncbi:MAG: DUF3014 domain-containing protein [Nitrospira sp.]|nr:DUF3014 domain-containing protein [Nitrospira sp.]
MKQLIVVAVIILGGALAAYYYWQQTQPEPEAVKVPALPPPIAPPKPEVRQVVKVPEAKFPLPKLGESDSFMLEALASLMGKESLMKVFRVEQFMHNIVVTIDNLPNQSLPVNTMPVTPAPGNLVVSVVDGEMSISPKNTARYTPYMRLAGVVSTKKLVALYLLLYPLFQQSYEELGYPNKYFNDRVIEVIDNLLAAPDMKEPVKLVQPKIVYVYADPDLEGRSIGQRILMRIGSDNEAKVKTKLQEIRQELFLHMQEEEVKTAE